jgi:predicted nucleic acid-binding protein
VIICDTGALVALLNAADDYHAVCRNLFATYPGRLIVPGPILTEVCYMAESRLAADASVVAVAERLKTARIATLDHRHFRAVRPAHCDAFELLPARS